MEKEKIIDVNNSENLTDYNIFPNKNSNINDLINSDISIIEKQQDKEEIREEPPVKKEPQPKIEYKINNINNTKENIQQEIDKSTQQQTKTNKFFSGIKNCFNKIDCFMRENYRIMIILFAIVIIITVIVIIKIKCFKKSEKYKKLTKDEIPKDRKQRKLLNQKYIVLEEQEKYNKLKNNI